MKETRAYEVQAGADPLIIEGTAVVFDQPADMYGYTERIEHSALDGVNLDDVTLLVNHDGSGIPLARSPKTLSLPLRTQGLKCVRNCRTHSRDTRFMKLSGVAICRKCLSRLTLRSNGDDFTKWQFF